MLKREYRIVYFNDNRYGGVERYVIVEGKFTKAIAMCEFLKGTNYAENVSEYHTLDSQYVMPFGAEPKLKPSYKDMSFRKFWD